MRARSPFRSEALFTTTATLVPAGVVALSVFLSCAHAPPPSKPAPSPQAPAASAPPPAPPLALIAAAEARAGLVASFVVPSLDRSLASGVGLVKEASPLPLEPAGVRDLLLSQAGLPPELAKHLDLATPITGASVVGWPGRGPLNAFTFGVRTPADVAPLLAGLGRTVARRGDAIQVENAAGDRGWFWPRGNVVVFADSEDALARAGALALEARRPAADDLVLTVNPDTMARAAGSDLKTVISRMLGEVENQASASGGKLGPEAIFQLRQMADYLMQTESAELAVNLDSGRGASLLARLHPRAGTKLETVARLNKPVALDPLVEVGVRAEKDGAGFVLASNYGAAVIDQLRRQRSRLPAAEGNKPAMAAARLLDALADGLTGELWMLGRGRPALSAEVVYQARDAAALAGIQAALVGTDKAALTALLKAATAGESIDLRVDKVRPVAFGKSRGVAATLSVPATAKDPSSQMLRKMVGKAGLELVAVVAPGERLVMTMGTGARARATALAATRPTSAPGATVTAAAKDGRGAAKSGAAGGGGDRGGAVLAAALGSVGGRSLFYLLDLRHALGVASALGADPRLGMLTAATAGAPIPVLGGMGGEAAGRTLTFDLTLPPSAFAGIGGLIQAAAMLPRGTGER